MNAKLSIIAIVLCTCYITTSLSGQITVNEQNKVGINKSAPDEQLDVDGNVKISGAIKDASGNNGTPGQVLTSDGVNNFKWEDAAATGWELTGNTVNGTEVIGTLNDYPFNIITGDPGGATSSIKLIIDNIGRIIPKFKGLSDHNLMIGDNAGNQNITGKNNNFIGKNAGRLTLSSDNNFIGVNTGYRNIDGSNNNFIGTNAGYYNESGYSNNFIGVNSGYSSTDGYHNSFFGTNSGYANTTGYRNVFIGSLAGRKNLDGRNNSFIGYSSGNKNESGYNNTYVGVQASLSNTTGFKNTSIGVNSGYKNNGNRNLFLGFEAGYNETSANDILVISNTRNRNLIYGEFDNKYLKVDGDLEVSQAFIDSDGDKGTAGQVLSSTGTETDWVDANNATAGWELTGNAVNGTEVLGTTSDHPLNIVTGDPGGATSSVKLVVDQIGRIIPKYKGGLNTQSLNNNILIGELAGNSNMSGSFNLLLGYKSGYSLSNGVFNNFIGVKSGYSNLGGDKNNFIGFESGYSNLSGESNNFLGYQAGFSNTTGNYNNFIGIWSGTSNTTGNNNVFVGSSAGNDNSSGHGNVFIGSSAGHNNSTGGQNIYIGQSSGFNNIDGIYNCFIGNSSGFRNITGEKNSFYGRNSGYNNSSGIDNTFFGYDSGRFNSIGNKNTCLGKSSNLALNNIINSSSVGIGAVVNANNKMRLGHTNNGYIVESQNGIWSPSDGRFKNNIDNNVPGLEFITKLQPVSYDFDAIGFDNHLSQNFPDSILLNENTLYLNESLSETKSGFIAQDIEQVCNDIGYDFSGLHVADPNNPTDNYSLNYASFVVPLVQAVKEQQVMITDLQQQNELLLRQFKELTRQIDKLSK